MKRFLVLLLVFIIFIQNSALAALSGVTNKRYANAMTESLSDRQFKISGNSQKFTMADTINGEFFVIANQNYGTAAFDSDATQGFDISDENNLAYRLNTDIPAALPEQISLYIDNEHEWETEPGNADGNCAEGKKVTCGISLLSQTEFEKYISVIGTYDNLYKELNNDEYSYWWTRSPNFNLNGYVMAIGTDNKCSVGFSADAKLMVRPVFYLKNDFFENVKLDVSYMGKAIKKRLADLGYSKLKAIGYNDYEIDIISDTASDSIVKIKVTPNWSDSDYDKNYVIDNPISFKVEFNNMSKVDFGFNLGWQINKAQRNASEISVPAGGKLVENVVLPDMADGRYKCSVILSNNNNAFEEYEYDVSYIKSVKIQKGRSQKGYATHFAHGNPPKETIELLKASGIGYIRDGGYWSNIERYGQGRYSWTSIDSYLQSVKNAGLDEIFILGLSNQNYYTYDESTGERVSFGSDEEIQAFVEYAKAVANKYPFLTKFEIYNEPNTKGFWGTEPDVTNYIKLVRAVSQALKSINPNIEIIAGVTAASTENTTERKNWLEYIENILKGATDYIDAISYHQYFNFHRRSDLNGSYEQITQLIAKYGGFVKLYLTETGGYTLTEEETWAKTESEKNEELVRLFAVGDEYGLEGVYIYDFIKDGTDLKKDEHNYGVVTNPEAGFIPTKSYYSVKNYMSMANNADYIGKINLTDMLSGYVYLQDDEPVMMAWSNSNNEYSYNFGSNVCVYDLFGKKIGEGTSFLIGSSPVYIYGLDKSIMAEAGISSAEKLLDSVKNELQQDNEIAENFSLCMQKIKNPENAQQIYEAIDCCFKIANIICEKQITDNGCIYKLYRAAEFMANSLAGFEDSLMISAESLRKSYKNFNKTLESLNKTEYSEKIVRFGTEMLDEISEYVCEEGNYISQGGDIYAINEKGILSIAGNAQKGSMVVIKITDSSDKLLYIGSVTADTQGDYIMKYPLGGKTGTYKVSICEGFSDNVKTSDFKCEINNNYVFGKRKILYGKTFIAGKLLELSKNYLFAHYDMEKDRILLIDGDWTVEENRASARFIIKNVSKSVNADVILAGYTDGKLTGLVKSRINIEQSDKKEYIENINFYQKPELLKAYIWDSISGMKPLSVVYEN